MHDCDGLRFGQDLQDVADQRRKIEPSGHHGITWEPRQLFRNARVQRTDHQRSAWKQFRAVPKIEPSRRRSERDHDIRRTLVGTRLQIPDINLLLLLVQGTPEIQVDFNEVVDAGLGLDLLFAQGRYGTPT